MFFGVNIGPRLGLGSDLGLEKQRDSTYNRVRSKYGVPFTSKWKIEVQNVSRDTSWQDLKDFCFNKTKVRPSHAELHKQKKGVGTLCCPTESDMRIVLRKLNGAILKGRPLTANTVVDKSSCSQNIEHSTSERIHGNRDGIGEDNASKTQHNSDDRKRIHRVRRDHQHGSAPNDRRKDESKVIIHQRNGDKVITERITNHGKEERHRSENEQTYFKRDQKTIIIHSDSDRDDDQLKNTKTNRNPSKKNEVNKYGQPGQTKWKIRVENLPSEINLQNLKDTIRPCADVMYAEAHKERKGVVIVHVSTQEDLQNVIRKLNNKDINGKPVRFIDDSGNEKLTREIAKSRRARSRSPHRSSQSTQKGNRTSKTK